MPCLSMNFNRQFVELYKRNLTFSFDTFKLIKIIIIKINYDIWRPCQPKLALCGCSILVGLEPRE